MGGNTAAGSRQDQEVPLRWMCRKKLIGGKQRGQEQYYRYVLCALVSSRSMDIRAHLHVCKVSGLCGQVARQTPLSPKNNIQFILIMQEDELETMWKGILGLSKTELFLALIQKTILWFLFMHDSTSSSNKFKDSLYLCSLHGVK